MITIELQNGSILKVDVSGLDYFTLQSFKEWVKQHAIANSEPLFNR